MVTLTNGYGERIVLDHGIFSVPESPALESLLNTLAKVHPVMNGGSPDPDAELVQNLVGIAPEMSVVENTTPDGEDDGDDEGLPKVY